MSAKSTVLIVDDEAAMREALRLLLNDLGHNLAFAGNGAEALRKAAELTPDLILLDIRMPILSGFEVCKRLRADSRLAEVPVIMVTALMDADSRRQGIEAGADDFVSKPFDYVELRARVQTTLRLNRYRRLLAERARFGWVVEHSDDGYLLVNHEDKILYANRQARLYLGLPPDEHAPIAEPFLALAQKQYHGEPQEAWVGWPAEPAAELPRSRYFVRPESLSAKAFWLQVDILAGGPEPDRLIRLRDVTEQMASQRDLWKFHSAISHKLRAPLVGIVVGLELLVAHASELSKEKVENLSQMALKGANRLQNEIDDIFQYLSAPSVTKASTSFSLSQLPSMVAEVSAQLGLESVVVTGHENVDDAHLMFTRHDVETVLSELLENAKKFHPQRTPRVEVQVAPPESGMVRLRVRDDGLTLSPEQLSKVWLPYYQGEKYFTGETTGMGLGLPLVATILWEVGGTCRLFNREGGPGVIVELDLPLMRNQAAPD